MQQGNITVQQVEEIIGNVLNEAFKELGQAQGQHQRIEEVEVRRVDDHGYEINLIVFDERTHGTWPITCRYQPDQAEQAHITLPTTTLAITEEGLLLNLQDPENPRMEAVVYLRKSTTGPGTFGFRFFFFPIPPEFPFDAEEEARATAILDVTNKKVFVFDGDDE